MSDGTSCERAYKELFPYLDRELSEEEMQQVRRHLADCPPCEHLFKLEGTVVRFIRERAPRDACPAQAVERILVGFRARVAARFAR
jgi:mycothiol system anti-sigma-R factor